jgi:outer membrane protein
MRPVFPARLLVRSGFSIAMVLCVSAMVRADVVVSSNAPAASGTAWLSQPLSLSDCLNLALGQNATILKSKQDVEAAYGIAIQTRAIVIPKVAAKGNYQIIDQASIDKIPFPGIANLPYPDQSWTATVQLVQSIYEGGRMASALRAARLTKQQALLNYQAVIADTLLDVRVGFADVLLALEQIKVQQSSVKLLTRELEDNERRYNAGTVPRFNFLRAAVQLTNAMPRLISAENAYRVAKNNLSNLLGYNLPSGVGEDIPLQLVGDLKYEPYQIELPSALSQALQRRPELEALRKTVGLRQEGIVNARAGYKPSVQVLAGYGSRNSQFTRDLTEDLTGWFAGGQFTWNIFDGRLTKGKVDEAKALHRKSRLDLEDTTRRIELEVRTAYSSFIEAKRVIEAQQEVEKLAEEALRLAQARSEAGTGTQLDVLDAETSLTEARSTHSQALHDYAVARARLEKAIGQNIMLSANTQ